MVSHKHYNLNANEDFVITFTSKFITCFRFQLGNKILVNCLFTKGKWPYFGFWTSRLSAHISGLEDCKGNLLGGDLDGEDNICWSRSKLDKKIWKDYPGCWITNLGPNTPFSPWWGSWLGRLGPAQMTWTLAPATITPHKIKINLG